MGFLKLFISASVPVLNVLLVTGLGSFLATNHVDILGEEARKHLNNVVFWVFNPSLVSTNLAKTITLENIVLLWFMPVNILLTFLVGSLFGWVVIHLTKAPPRLRGLILGCCAAGNLGNLLLIIIPTICKEKGNPFGDPDVCHTYSLAYASLSMAIGGIFLWSYVYNIVRISSYSTVEKANNNCHTPANEFPDETTKLLEGNTSTSGNTSPRKYSVFGTCTTEQLPVSRSMESSSKLKVPIFVRLRRSLSNVSELVDLKKLFAPSTIGVIVGFVVGVVPPIRKAMIGETAPFRVIQDSTSLLSGGAIPTLTLIMGGNPLKGLQGPSVQFSLIVGVIVVRYILLPVLGIVIVKGVIRLGLVHADPLYQFVLLLQYALPTAAICRSFISVLSLNYLVLVKVNVLLFSYGVYALASVFLTLWSMLFMWLVS